MVENLRHRHYFCDICYAGFISEPLLVEHQVKDHPEGHPAEPSECVPSTRAETPEITITKVVDPELDKVMEIVHTPEPDPFADKWHPALGQTRPDSKNKIECEVCHRYLKSFKLRVEHVKHFHPLIAYDCKFCPGMVFYTFEDLLKHYTDLHFVCEHCDSAHKDKDALKEHMARQHLPAPQPTQAATSSTDTPESSSDPNTSTASDANICPAQLGFVCGMCKMYCQTKASFKIHITTHKKTPCPFCPQKFYNPASRTKHVSKKHNERHNRKLSCRLAPACEETFNSLKELGIHSRQVHRSTFQWRCSYKDCFDCFITMEDLVKHGQTHGKESWDDTHSPEDKKDRYIGSLCSEMFDKLTELMTHTQVYPENKYKCDECGWHFYLISVLSLHGQDCHGTRHHACEWCVEYFDSADGLHTHIWSKHHFECSICHDSFSTAEKLEDHERNKHGGLQPDEQELQLIRHREEKQEKQEQSERRKEKTKEQAKQKKYFACTECMKGFESKKELDDHITGKHAFICVECLKIFHVKAERDAHMKKDHKSQSAKLTEHEKLLAKEWHEKVVQGREGQTNQKGMGRSMGSIQS